MRVVNVSLRGIIQNCRKLGVDRIELKGEVYTHVEKKKGRKNIYIIYVFIEHTQETYPCFVNASAIL